MATVCNFLSPATPALLFFFVLLLSTFPPHPIHAAAVNDRWTTNLSSQRTILAAAGQTQRSRSNHQIPNCKNIVTQPQCNLSPSCQWCRSDVLDDMCFHKLEAWRLPSQVFTCGHKVRSRYMT